MNKNQNIAMGISLAVVAIMVGSAEIFGEKEIIFPEITAVAMGALIAPVQSWNTSYSFGTSCSSERYNTVKN